MRGIGRDVRLTLGTLTALMCLFMIYGIIEYSIQGRPEDVVHCVFWGSVGAFETYLLLWDKC